MQIYMADPSGLSEANHYFYENDLKVTLETSGYKLVGPWIMRRPVNVLHSPFARFGEIHTPWVDLIEKIGIENFNILASSRALLCLLDGRDMPSSTAAAMGQAFGLSMPIFVFRGDFGHLADADGLEIDIQAEFLVQASGGVVATRVADLLTALQVYEANLVSRLVR